MKRILSAVISFLLILGLMPTAEAVGTSASSAILMEAQSGKVLYEQNIHDRRLIASITKLMTALVAIESKVDLQKTIEVDPAWTGIEGSSIYLQAGEKVTLELLLYGMLLRSGNDAAIAAAAVCGGTVEEFVARMNDKAAQLGMKNSSFANPNGLNADDHYSTAYDMALLARACLENETLSKIVSTKSITLGTRVFTNHNKLLWRYDGCLGLKTGYTEKAGRTLVSAAQRDGMTLICVTLNDPDDWSDHAGLFDFGFEQYKVEPLCSAGEAICRLPVENSLIPFAQVVTGEDSSVVLQHGETVERRTELEIRSLRAPVPAGTLVGEALWLSNGEVIARTDLITKTDIPSNKAEDGGFMNWLRAVKER